MGKLGYTWYPKDWGNSDAVFELTLSERGFYRELIDMVMLNDNRTKWNVNLWARKFNATTDEICDISDKLCDLGLIEFRFFENQDKELDAREWVFIPSCEARLNLVRGGKNGGKKSKKDKPTPKPIVKPNVKPTPKPTPNQKKEKRKEIKEKNAHNFDSEDYKHELWDYLLEYCEKNNLDVKKVKNEALKAYEYYKELGWKNSNNKKIINLKSTIRNNWLSDLSKFSKDAKAWDW